MKRVFISLALALSACTPTPPRPAIDINGNKVEIDLATVRVSDMNWRLWGLTDYPFTTAGEIYCLGNAVYFNPLHMKNDDVGQPLNQKAVDWLKSDGLTPTIPYPIKPNADLTQAITIGLKVCDFDKKEFDRTH